MPSCKEERKAGGGHRQSSDTHGVLLRHKHGRFKIKAYWLFLLLYEIKILSIGLYELEMTENDEQSPGAQGDIFIGFVQPTVKSQLYKTHKNRKIAHLKSWKLLPLGLIHEVSNL